MNILHLCVEWFVFILSEKNDFLIFYISVSWIVWVVIYFLYARLFKCPEGCSEHFVEEHIINGILFTVFKPFQINHLLLLKKLYYYEVYGTLLSWFKSYLIGRIVFMVIKGKKSSGILPPLLFINHVNDLYDWLKIKYKHECWELYNIFSNLQKCVFIVCSLHK